MAEITTRILNLVARNCNSYRLDDAGTLVHQPVTLASICQLVADVEEHGVLEAQHRAWTEGYEARKWDEHDLERPASELSQNPYPDPEETRKARADPDKLRDDDFDPLALDETPLHKLWGIAREQPGYNKNDWKILQRELQARFAPATAREGIPMRLVCEGCGKLHIDEGEFATKPHHTHVCQFCGLTWRPAIVTTVGVQFLPGFKNASEPQASGNKS